MNADNLYHRGFKPLLEKARLCGFTFHSLRHTCATLLLSKNVNPKIVQEMLGHATISQTMDTYSHVMPGMQDAAVTAMESVLSRLETPGTRTQRYQLRRCRTALQPRRRAIVQRVDGQS
jgi:hypothetical protein